MPSRRDADGSHGSRVAPLRGLPGRTEKEYAELRTYAFFSFHFPSTSTMLGTYCSPKPMLLAIA